MPKRKPKKKPLPSVRQEIRSTLESRLDALLNTMREHAQHVESVFAVHIMAGAVDDGHKAPRWPLAQFINKLAGRGQVESYGGADALMHTVAARVGTPPKTVDDALDRIEAGKADLLDKAAGLVLDLCNSMPVKARSKRQARALVPVAKKDNQQHATCVEWAKTTTWPVDTEAGCLLNLLLYVLHLPSERLSDGRLVGGPLGIWPADAAPGDVAAWLAPFKPLGIDLPGPLLEHVRASGDMPSIMLDAGGRKILLPASVLAHLRLAQRIVDERRHSEMMAISTTQAGSDVLRAFVGTGRRGGQVDCEDESLLSADGELFFEVLPPGMPKQSGESAQLVLPTTMVSSPEVAIMEAMRAIRANPAEVLVDWYAIMAMGTKQGRAQAIRWTADEYLAITGAHAAAVHKKDARQRPVENIKLMAQSKLRVWDAPPEANSRRLRYTCNLLSYSVYDKVTFDENKRPIRADLLAVDITLDQKIFGGIRKQSGRLGNQFLMFPALLAQMDATTHGPALLISAYLISMYQVNLRANGRRHVRVKAIDLLAAGGMRISQNNPSLARQALINQLRAAQQYGAIGDWRTVQGEVGSIQDWMLDIDMPPLTLDVGTRGLLPKNPEAPPPPHTGDDLTAWRKARGLTMEAAASLIGCGLNTLRRNERQGKRQITRRVRRLVAAVIESEKKKT